jgi:hypothetical protein
MTPVVLHLVPCTLHDTTCAKQVAKSDRDKQTDRCMIKHKNVLEPKS